MATDALLELAKDLTKRAHLLVPGLGDEALSLSARNTAKAAFDRALQGEARSYPRLSSLLASLAPDDAPTTRSAAAKKEKEEDRAAKRAIAEPSIVESTPLESLTVDGLDAEGVWEQMELRNKVVDKVLGEMFGSNGAEDAEDDEGATESSSEDDDDEDDEDEMVEDGLSDEEEEYESGDEDNYESEEYSRALRSATSSSDVEQDDDEEDDQVEAQRPSTSALTLDNFDDQPVASSSKRRKGPASAIDDDFFSLADFHKQTDEGEFEMAKALRGEADDEDEDGDELKDDFDLFGDVDNLSDGDEQEGDLDSAGIMYRDFFDPPARSSKRSVKTVKNGTRAESKKRRSPAPAAHDQNGVEPPRKKAKVRFSDAVRVKTIAARKQTEFEKLAEQIGEVKARQIMEEALLNGEDDEDDDDEQMDEDGSDEGDDDEDGAGDLSLDAEDDDDMDDVDLDGLEDEEEDAFGSEAVDDSQIIDRFRSDLLADDEEEADKRNLSKRERKLLALSSQIAALEAENVGPKNWATRGEVKSKNRPVNSLLEEDLEFERAGKVVPVVTEETTKTIEDLIKRRILDNNFDDVERRRSVDPNAFLPSRYLEVQDTKSGKSLAEIYEEDFTQAKEREAGRKVTNALDADLEKKHQEIEALFEELSSKLDALSNAHFTPKAPKATITTISNLPAISMESAMPTTQSAAARLAPEEVHVPDTANEDRSDLTPAQKRAQRQKKRKERAEAAKKRDRFVSDKDKAKKALLGVRGVTVLGKRGDAGAATTPNGTKQKKHVKKASAADASLGTSSVAIKL